MSAAPRPEPRAGIRLVDSPLVTTPAQAEASRELQAHLAEEAHRGQALDAQTDRARAMLTAPSTDAIAWPWPEIDAISAPMVPGTVHTVAAFSGTGKTTLLLSAVDAWVEAGVPLYVLPLEMSTDAWRVQWACHRLAPAYPDLDPGDVATRKLHARADNGDGRAVELLAAVDAEVLALSRPPFSELLHLEDRARELSPRVARAACRAAGQHGFKLVIIDHLDHTDGEEPSPYRDAQQIIRACLKSSEDFGVPVLGTKQCNNDVVRGPDHLARYQPPREQHIKNGGATREDATTMLGIFRPLRGREPGEFPHRDGKKLVDPYVEFMKAARKGLVEPWRALVPNVTGLVCLKNRPYGRLEGRRAYLGFSQGRNVPLSPMQRRELEQAEHAIRTTGATL